MVEAKQKYEVSSTIKAFEILKVLSDSEPHRGLSLAELSKIMSGSKSTIHRYLSTLEQIGFVEKNDRDTYFLGSGLLQLAGHYLNNINLPQLAEPFMRELAEKCQETVHLAVPSDSEVVYVGKVDGPLSIRLMAKIGTRMPMYCTALGKSILAYSPNERIEAVVANGLPARTSSTITTVDKLLEELEKVRSFGFAVDNIENEDGVRCVGAPIFDYSKKLVGAISLSGPIYRVTEERVPELGEMVRDTALSISRRMGYPH